MFPDWENMERDEFQKMLRHEFKATFDDKYSEGIYARNLDVLETICFNMFCEGVRHGIEMERAKYDGHY